MGSSAPALHWPDATVQTDSVEVLRSNPNPNPNPNPKPSPHPSPNQVLRALDAALPSSTPLWPPAGVEARAVDEMVG